MRSTENVTSASQSIRKVVIYQLSGTPGPKTYTCVIPGNETFSHTRMSVNDACERAARQKDLDQSAGSLLPYSSTEQRNS